jgi:hypothetical protein
MKLIARYQADDGAPPASAWMAYLVDVADDGSDLIGLGPTRDAALADLQRQLTTLALAEGKVP